jgi:hypothetical protein
MDPGKRIQKRLYYFNIVSNNKCDYGKRLGINTVYEEKAMAKLIDLDKSLQ